MLKKRSKAWMRLLSRAAFCLAMMALIVLIGALMASAEVYSGECGAQGDNVAWTLDTETGVLLIEGQGSTEGVFAVRKPHLVSPSGFYQGGYALLGHNQRRSLALFRMQEAGEGQPARQCYLHRDPRVFGVYPAEGGHVVRESDRNGGLRVFRLRQSV